MPVPEGRAFDPSSSESKLAMPKAYSLSAMRSSMSSSFSRSAAFCAAAKGAETQGDVVISKHQTNPLLKQDALPRFHEIQPADVLPAIEACISQVRADFKILEESLQRKDGTYVSDYSQAVERLEALTAPLDYSWEVVKHLLGVSNSDELRVAHDAAQPKVIELMQSIGQSQHIYKALLSLQNDADKWAKLEPAQKRIVESSLKDMQHSGVGLDAAQRVHFNKLGQELAALSSKFSNNVLDSTKAFSLTIASADKDQLKGIPESALRMFAANAVKEGHVGATAQSGPWTLALDMAAYLPIMQHSQNRALRERVYRAYVTRASAGEQDNAPIISRILDIKTEIAHMLGYDSHAAKSLSVKMAPSVKAVEDLTEMLYSAAYPAAKSEFSALQTFARAHGFVGELSLWDIPFWSERQREALYEFSEEELRPYFPLSKVLTGLFALASRLFGIRIVAADGETSVWHEDVKFFKIYDEATNKHIASFYLDAFSRPSNKRGGAWMSSCQGKSKVLNRNIPVAYLTCNGSPPVGDTPSLMTFREVETLFHEFGHGLQHMLTAVEHGPAAGISGVEWDAVELPSQMMENFCYDTPTLASFAKHYQTGEPLPAALFDKVIRAKHYQSGLQMIRQLYFGSMDMYLHSTKFDPKGVLSVFDVQRALSKKYTVVPPLPEDRFLCSFGHIFSGGYSAGYYSYKYAEVMSADCFAAFEEGGLSNEAAVRATGRRFRNTVLAMGGGTPPADVFRAFRGRDPSPAALLRHSGLSPK